jgi:hypothetical protein
VKRTTENLGVSTGSGCDRIKENGCVMIPSLALGVLTLLSRPLHGLAQKSESRPTDESVGYYHSSASPTFAAKQCLEFRAGEKVCHSQSGTS